VLARHRDDGPQRRHIQVRLGGIIDRALASPAS